MASKRNESNRKVKHTATHTDLIYRSNSEFRAFTEVYAGDDAKEKFIKDFVKTWTIIPSTENEFTGAVSKFLLLRPVNACAHP